MNLSFFLALCLSFTLSVTAFAQGAEQDPNAPLCVNSSNTKKNLTGQDINISIASASDPLSKAFKVYQSKENKICADMESEPFFSKVISAIEKITPEFSANPPTYIKKECIAAALQRDIAQEAYVCDKDTSKSEPIKRQCLNQNSVDYIHYAINSALKCFATITTPIDARTIYKKINNESGFNFFFAYGGGMGMGQLTKWPILEIGHTGEGNGNARRILEALAASENPTCAPFREVARKDLEDAPKIPANASKNRCDWISTNEGVTRNLIYALGYYVSNRDHIKQSLRENGAERLLVNRELVNTLTLFSYGPNGPNNLDTFLFRSQPGRKSPAALLKELYAFDAKLERHYLGETDKSMKEAMENLTGNDKPSREEMRGDTCVEK